MRGIALISVHAVFWLAVPVHAQPDTALRARLLSEYTATRAPSTGCSLGEVERRLGLLNDAGAHLDAALEAVETGGAPAERATASACRFNLARVYEDRGLLRDAYRMLARALETPNVERRRTVERRLVQVASRLVQAEGCASLTSRYSAQALLRFGDDQALRGCVQTARRGEPVCTSIPASEIPSDDDLAGARTLDANTRVFIDQRYLVVITRRGGRASGFECRLPNDDERLRFATWVPLGRQHLIEVSTETTVSYACDCDEGDELGECRCEDYSATMYLLRPNGEILLALVDSGADRGGMATWGEYADELQDVAESPTTVEGDVLVVNGRRLRLVRGALVPAPEPTAR